MIVVNACAARVRLCRRLQATGLCVCVTATGIFCVFTCFPSVFSTFARFSTSSLSFLRIGTVFLLFHVFQRIQVLSFLYGSSFFCTFTRFSIYLLHVLSPHMHVFIRLHLSPFTCSMSFERFIPAPCVFSQFTRFSNLSTCFLHISAFSAYSEVSVIFSVHCM